MWNKETIESEHKNQFAAAQQSAKRGSDSLGRRTFMKRLGMAGFAAVPGGTLLMSERAEGAVRLLMSAATRNREVFQQAAKHG